MNILWKVAHLTPNIASLRYRCLIPVFESIKCREKINHYLRDKVTCDIFFLNLDIAVFVKTVVSHDLKLARELKAKGVFIIFDTCDNLFVEHKDPQLRLNFRTMLEMADKVTVPTPTLLNTLLEHMGKDFSKKVMVIVDPSENLDHIKFSKKFVLNRISKDIFRSGKIWLYGFYVLHCCRDLFFHFLKNVYHYYIQFILLFFSKSFKKKICESNSKEEVACALPRFPRYLIFPYVLPFIFLRCLTFNKIDISYKYRYDLLKKYCTPQSIESAQPSSSQLSKSASQCGEASLQLLWFGNSGTYDVFGISDLLLIRQELESLHKKKSLCLTIISNNTNDFERLTKSINIPMKYKPWTLERVYEEAQNYDCVLLPNPMNEFSRGKSANRTLLSLSLGIPVVATETPELLKLSRFVSFGPWEEALLRYKEDKAWKTQQLSDFQVYFANSPHHPRNVWSAWSTMFKQVRNREF